MNEIEIQYRRNPPRRMYARRLGIDKRPILAVFRYHAGWNSYCRLDDVYFARSDVLRDLLLSLSKSKRTANEI